LTAGFVQWFKVARDDSGGFRFVPASWSDITLPAQAIGPEAGAATAAAAEDTAERPVGAAPGGEIHLISGARPRSPRAHRGGLLRGVDFIRIGPLEP
jgi:hypothetical protein